MSKRPNRNIQPASKRLADADRTNKRNDDGEKWSIKILHEVKPSSAVYSAPNGIAGGNGNNDKDEAAETSGPATTANIKTDDKIETAKAAAKTDDAAKLPSDILGKFQTVPGKLMIAGNVSWDITNRRGPRKQLCVFNRFTDNKYRAAFSGPASAHSVLITEDYKAFSFGRNEHGQCGHKPFTTFNIPKLVEGLKELNVIQAACGNNHTMFLTDTGTVYACGDNKYGQLGIRNKGHEIVSTPTRIDYDGPPICKIGCGGEFSVILNITGNLYSFGHPEHGQLGNGTDGKYFISNTKLSFAFQFKPTLVTGYNEKGKSGSSTPIPRVKIVDFACGKNHTVAIDSQKRAFSFGFGGYGRLGHNANSNETYPRLIKYLNMTVTGGAVRVFCGAAFNLVIGGHNIPYIFGKNKNTASGEGQMYPKAVDQLCGFNYKSIGCSVTSVLLATDDKELIAWGPSPAYGELGIGDTPKSSSQPTFVKSMKGMDIVSVAMGLEHSMLLVNIDDDETNKKYLTHTEFAPTRRITF